MWKECNITCVPIMFEVVSVCVSPRLHLSEYVIIRARDKLTVDSSHRWDVIVEEWETRSSSSDHRQVLDQVICETGGRYTLTVYNVMRT